MSTHRTPTHHHCAACECNIPVAHWREHLMDVGDGPLQDWSCVALNHARRGGIRMDRRMDLRPIAMRPRVVRPPIPRPPQPVADHHALDAVIQAVAHLNAIALMVTLVCAVPGVALWAIGVTSTVMRVSAVALVLTGALFTVGAVLTLWKRTDS